MGFWNLKKNQDSSSVSFESKPIIGISLMFVVIIILISALYLHFAWVKYRDEARSEAILLAQSLLHPEHIATISANNGDQKTPEYTMTQVSLERLVESTDWVRYAYLLYERDGHLSIIVDSKDKDPSGLIKSGQEYLLPDSQYLVPFHSGEIAFIDPDTNSRGKWATVLVPVYNPSDGAVLAALGFVIDGPAWSVRIWKRMIPDLFFTVAFLVVFLVFLLFQKQRKDLTLDKALYQNIFEQAPTGVAIMIDENIITPSKYIPNPINPMFEQILGRTSSELAALTWSEITHPDDLKADLEKFNQFKRGEIPGYSMEKRYLRPDGSSVWTNMKIAPLLEDMDTHPMHLCLLEDISSRKKAEDALRESERDKSILLSNLPGMAYRCKNDPDWTMLFASDGCFQLTGYKSGSIICNKDLSYNDLILPEYRRSLRNEWDRVLAKRLPFKYEYEIVTNKGEHKWVLEMGEGVYDEHGDVQSLEGLILDISERKQMENVLKYNNEHDVWTGLFNRQYLENLLHEEARHVTLGKRALVAINLSAVSSLNLTYGFQYSQQLIKETAEVLKTMCTDTHQLYATYVHRFVFHIKDYRDENELSSFCKSISTALDTLLAVERVSFGIGIIEIREDAKDNVNQLLKNLLIASEIAVETFETGTGICFFNNEMEANITRKETIKRELAEIAVDDTSKKLFLQFQPILDLGSNKICGFEALARLHSDHFGLVSPMEFIPFAEETKLIIPLGKQIIRQAFHFLNMLALKGFDTIEVSINISAIQLLRKGFSESLFGLIHEMQVNPNTVCLEITESILVSNFQEICRVIEELRICGLKIAIDDLGTGYSSLSRLREFNANYIKIDKYFIDKLTEVTPEHAITGDIISMAHKLGSRVIAEGIEHEKQLQYLKDHDCDMIQGYLIAKPLDKDDAFDLITRHMEQNETCGLDGKQ